MVTRPNMVPAPLSQAANNPPYPTTPTSELPPSPLDGTVGPLAAVDEEDIQSHGHLDDRAHGTDSEWDSSDDGDEEGKPHTPEDLPAPLKIHEPRAAEASQQGLPTALRAGPSEGIRNGPQGMHPRTNVVTESLEHPSDPMMTASSLRSNNPYLRMRDQRVVDGTAADSEAAVHPENSINTGPVELPSQHTPIEQMAEMSIASRSERKDSSAQPPLLAVETESFGPALPNDSGPEAGAVQLPDPSSSGKAASRESAPSTDSVHLHMERPGGAWEQDDREARERIISATSAQVGPQERDRIVQAAKPEVASSSDEYPPLPPRPSDNNEQPPPKPPRPGPAGLSSQTEAPEDTVDRQRREHYQIKHISWTDSTGALRRSPILTQNANGPCPLLALVNALVLSTPAGENTALVENLRTREQVSLGLLLDAVFDELMSGRRGGAAQELPDVTDLYSFLATLHTGMNVNPRFFRPPQPANLMDARPTDALPAHQVPPGPGDFEETREMRLYSTFNVPLIHGWLPQPQAPEYDAFMRAARTYEDAQNVQFREEELEAKLRTQGLTPEEQQLFQDVVTIKDFLAQWPTQLTTCGLAVMASSLKPSQISILFRNDHFLTLYKEPRSGRLFTLVTDAGYSSHQEIIWETLADVSGQRSELYSGDFRLVGPMSSQKQTGASPGDRPIRSLLDVEDEGTGWTTGQGRSGSRQQDDGVQLPQEQAQPRQHGQTPASESQAPLSAAEQEDHDLALALQLQEEEEDRHRREQESRRREEELSRQFLSHDSNSPASPPTIPPRRSAAQQRNSGIRNSSGDAPPPTYEQAASGPPYHPPRDHPASPHAPMQPSGVGSTPMGRGRGQFVYQAPGTGRGGRNAGRGAFANQLPGGPGGPPLGRGRGGNPHAPPVEDKERCVVM